MSIHASAVVSDRAHIDPSAHIGPFCIVEEGVHIGPKTQLISHVYVGARTIIGHSNRIHPFASIGDLPQDLKYAGEPGCVIIGDHNIIRENVTINIGTSHGGLETKIGHHCLLMAYAHVAHDCLLGDHIVIANGVALAGHVQVEDQAIVGGLAGVHQFCRIGRLALVAGGAMVAQDVPPFTLVQGDRAQLVGLNRIGLKRAGWSHTQMVAVHRAMQYLVQQGRFASTAAQSLCDGLEDEDPVCQLVRFWQHPGRGICPMRRKSHLEQDNEHGIPTQPS